MRLLSGAITALALAALAFIGWGAQLLPFPACGIRAGPCEVAGGVYSARLPTSDTAQRRPAVLFLHGSSGSGEAFIQTELSDAILRQGWGVIAPTGLQMPYSTGFGSGWNVRNFPGPERNEAAFLEAVLADAVDQFKIDRDRILVVGYSNGAFLTWDIACTRPDLARAYAAISGTFFGQPPERCAGGVPILHIHGLQDRGVPAGGNTRYAPADAGFALFRRANGCRPGRPRIARLPGGASRTDWPGCRAASPMTKILLDEGHRLSPDMLETALDWFKEIGAAY